MPRYRFIDTDTDEIVELELDFQYVFENQNGPYLLHDGKLLKRDLNTEFAQICKKSEKQVKLGPLKRISAAAGVHPDQVDDAREHYSKVHPGISFHNNGDAEFSSRGARKAFLKAAGMRDHNGGYGD